MFVSNYKINVSVFNTATTATTITIPLNTETQLVDNSDLVGTQFVDVEVENAINPIIDYEKVRFVPLDNEDNNVRNINYNVNLLNGSSLKIPTMYSDAGFADEDILLRKNTFTNSLLFLNFYDSDNALVQNLITDLTIYSMITQADLSPDGLSSGKPKPATQIPIKFTLSSPFSNGFSEGFHLYDFKSGLLVDVPRILYMRASYLNAKTGTQLNLMTEPTAFTIDELNKKLYTKYILKRTTTGYHYTIDDLYSNNIVYNSIIDSSDVTINLYQIQAL
jgi:hypothetical protein